MIYLIHVFNILKKQNLKFEKKWGKKNLWETQKERFVLREIILIYKMHTIF